MPFHVRCESFEEVRRSRLSLDGWKVRSVEFVDYGTSSYEVLEVDGQT